MALLAFRREYKIEVDKVRNNAVYERFEELTLATELPFYVSDWERVAARLQPGFTLLYDLRRTLGPNVHLMPVFLAAQRLLLEAGVAMVAEVHPPAPTMHTISRVLQQQSGLPVRLFTSRPEAEVFLAEFRAGLHPAR